MTSANLRFAERRDAGGSVPGPPAAGLVDNRVESDVMLPIRFCSHSSDVPAIPWLRFRYGWRTCRGSLWHGSERLGQKEADMTERLTAEARKEAVKALSGWSEVPGREAIARTFTF